MKFLWTLLFFAASCFGQSLGEGGVNAAQLIPGVAYDFELCCGGPGSGFVGNGFAYDDGMFHLYYKGTGCLEGCSVNGTIDTWFYPQSISKYCTVQSALLTVNLDSFRWYGNVPAEYSQIFCVENGNHWSGPGGLVVHLSTSE
jgi:hypothetical protein